MIPAANGQHRLYVNGGMRAAAGVGDTASLELRAASPAAVRPPADLARALRRVEAARQALDALSPSHRSELLRYIDDARSPQARLRRIHKTIDYVFGRRREADRLGRDRPL